MSHMTVEFLFGFCKCNHKALLKHARGQNIFSNIYFKFLNFVIAALKPLFYKLYSTFNGNSHNKVIAILVLKRWTFLLDDLVTYVFSQLRSQH